MPKNFQRNQDTIITKPSGACGRADLLLALSIAERDETRENALAAILGYVPVSNSIGDEIINAEPAKIFTDAVTETVLSPSPTKPLFRPYYLVSIDNEVTSEAWGEKLPDSGESGTLTRDDQASWDPKRSAPKALPIVPWTRLWPRLRQVAAQTRAAALDVARLTKQLSHGLTVRRLPRKARLNWPNPLPVVLDFSDRLTPYWGDWHWFKQQLQVRFNQQVRIYRLHGVPQRDLQRMILGRPERQFVTWPKLVSGGTLLLVSDLGMVDPRHPWSATCWQYKLADYRRRGVRVIVLAPVSIRHLQPSLVNMAEVVRLSPDSVLRPVRRMPPRSVSQAERKLVLSPAGEKLLAMMAVATRVEPGLLRTLRSCLPNHSHDVGLEGEVWCYPELDTAATACALTQWAVQKWRKKFVELPGELQQHALECMRNWHAGLPQVIHHEETLLWRHLAKRQVAENEEFHAKRARDFFYKLKNTLNASDTTNSKSSTRALQIQFADRHVHWVAPTLGRTEPYVAQLSVAVAQAEPERAQTGLPVGMDPVAWLKSLPGTVPQRFNLLQETDLSLNVADLSQTPFSGCSRLATFELDREAVLWAWGQPEDISVYQPWNLVDSDKDQAPVLPRLLAINTKQQPATHLYLHTGCQRFNFEIFDPPAWATAWGQDAYGFYADLSLQNSVQRFRWIAPGAFLMGSPESEPERRDNETQHAVTLTQGYWLADSACTQALWLAVKGGNPSHFKDDANQPVEQVSWNDVQQFIKQLNDRYEDLYARLPTEAEWEYACRAGTTTPFSFGENITPEQVNYHGFYPYAGGAKGLYREQTVPVKSLPPNPWGLYEMHGNVWEWCADGYRPYKSEAVADPVGPEGDSFDRVLRGGSWIDDGWNVRAASRGRGIPANRVYYIGFRLALGRAGVSRQVNR